MDFIYLPCPEQTGKFPQNSIFTEFFHVPKLNCEIILRKMDTYSPMQPPRTGVFSLKIRPNVYLIGRLPLHLSHLGRLIIDNYKRTVVLLMAEIRQTHQFSGQVVYPIIYRVSAPSKRWLVGNGISAINHMSRAHGASNKPQGPC